MALGKTTELLNEALMNGKRYIKSDNNASKASINNVKNPQTFPSIANNGTNMDDNENEQSKIDLEDLLEKKKPRLLKKFYNNSNLQGTYTAKAHAQPKPVNQHHHSNKTDLDNSDPQTHNKNGKHGD